MKIIIILFYIIIIINNLLFVKYGMDSVLNDI